MSTTNLYLNKHKQMSLTSILNTPLSVLLEQNENPKPKKFYELSSRDQKNFIKWYSDTMNITTPISSDKAILVWADSAALSDKFWKTASLDNEGSTINNQSPTDPPLNRENTPGWLIDFLEGIPSLTTNQKFGLLGIVLLYAFNVLGARTVINRFMKWFFGVIIKWIGVPIYNWTLGKLVKYLFGEMITTYRNNALKGVLAEIKSIEDDIARRMLASKEVFGYEKYLDDVFGSGFVGVGDDKRAIVKLTREAFKMLRNPEITAALNETAMAKAKELFKAGHLRPSHLHSMMSPEAWAASKDKILKTFEQTLKKNPNHWDKSPIPRGAIDKNIDKAYLSTW